MLPSKPNSQLHLAMDSFHLRLGGQLGSEQNLHQNSKQIELNERHRHWLVVSTHLKNNSQTVDHFPRDRGENKKYLKPPSRTSFRHKPVNHLWILGLNQPAPWWFRPPGCHCGSWPGQVGGIMAGAIGGPQGAGGIPTKCHVMAFLLLVEDIWRSPVDKVKIALFTKVLLYIPGGWEGDFWSINITNPWDERSYLPTWKPCKSTKCRYTYKYASHMDPMGERLGVFFEVGPAPCFSHHGFSHRPKDWAPAGGQGHPHLG